MSATEIILIIIGFITVVVGYVMPATLTKSGMEEANAQDARRNVEEILNRSLEEARLTIRDSIEDTLEETMVKSERGMERITNDKMAAISDYASSVLGDITKNHDEVVFMYDMLNDKHKNLTNLVTDVTKSADDARQTVQNAELTAGEAMQTAHEAMEQLRLVQEALEGALARARQAGETEAVAHAEAALPNMMRLPDQWFAPLQQEFPTVQTADGQYKVFQSAPPTEEETENAAAAEMVANALSSKVVPITSGMRHETEPVAGEKQAQILEMHAMGKSNVAIARELSLGVGEVRLVIDLFSKKRKKA